MSVALPNEVIDKQEKIKSIFDVISKLSNLKKKGWENWARKNASEMLDNGFAVDEILQKFFDYDQILADVVEIEQIVPEDKKLNILNWVFEELNKETHGEKHEHKIETIKKIKEILHLWKENQNLTRFSTFEKMNLDPVGKRVLKIVDAEEQTEFKKLYEQVFTKEFWKQTTNISPMEATNFTSTFNFQTENDFLTNFTMDSLRTFPELLRSSIISDAKLLVGDFFSDKEKEKLLKDLRKIPSGNPTAILKTLDLISQKKEKNRAEAKAAISQAKKFLLEQNPRSASAEIMEMEKKFGTKITSDLNEQRFVTSLNVTLAQVDYLETKINETTDPKKRAELLAKLRTIDSGESGFSHFKNLNQEEKKAKIQALKNEINNYRQHGDLRSAKSVAQRLRSLDSQTGSSEIAKINDEMSKLADSDKQKDAEAKTDQKLEVSSGKAKKIEFLERCIEHAQKVKEACDQLGIPKNHSSYWGEEGIKNRVKWLKDNGLWETYRKFNASDPNMPDSSVGNGFQFRWMDSRGSELTAYRAEDGIKYMNRYKESGYTLAALGAAFSVNWESMSSPVYTPDLFIEKVLEQLNEVKKQ